MPSYGASRTQLGNSIGSLAASLLSGSGRQEGMMDGYKLLLYKNKADKAGLEAEKLRLEQSRDPGLEAAGEMGLVGEDAQRFNDAITTGSYDKDPVAYNPDGSTDFSRSGPAAQQFEPKQIQLGAILKNTLSRGGKADDLAKALGDAHRNYLGYQVTPENVADVGAMVGATEGKPLEGVKSQLMMKIANGGGTDVVRGLLAAAGKGQFDNMNGGVYNVDTGQQELNSIGTSAAAENNAQASQARAGAIGNIARADLATARKEWGPSGVNVKSSAPKIPNTHKKVLAENSSAINQIDKAIKAIESNPDALGYQNVLGDDVNQRIDPKGVSTRALVAGIGGIKLHDLSGAAISPSESKRLMPMIPTSTDRADAAIAKLRELRNEYSGVNTEIEGMYSSKNENPDWQKVSDPTAEIEQLQQQGETDAADQLEAMVERQSNPDPFAGFTPELKAQFLQEHPDWNQ